MTFMQSSTHLHEDFFFNFLVARVRDDDDERCVACDRWGEAHREQVKQTLCADFMLNLPSVMSRVCDMCAH